ncbi:BREX system serine/threonine kinase PglW [Halochromatium glycolicum]|uniref:Serine/threonine protein kinase n=1 Tax=Halochromatium glycolicum TaxID=85075 RepID=A0AAJ0U480_9GAMM|nr:BREX system serine/threonine kinase PglW [Halochromatium glycolicum]MBK1704926.1 serine/threonine protein kinase [Halochromatium glycolicum]
MDKLWKQITPSDYAWEHEALDFLRHKLPDHEPYRVWANFEFIAQDGSINEVDALVVTPKGVHLVEIKSHPGAISGDAGSWVWSFEGRRRVFDNPRLLAERKAKKLASLLRSQRAALAKRGQARIPFITALVFLSAPEVVNRLQGPARLQVCTRKNLIDTLTRLAGNGRDRTVDRPTSKLVARALEEAGIKESLRARRVGLYELGELLDEADHFQDWLATHSETGLQRRIRIYLTRGKPEAEAQTLHKAARLEFRLLEGLEHPGILRAREYQQHDQGPALVYEHDPAAERLDHHLLGLGLGLDRERRLEPLAALTLMRRLAEAVQYAHAHRLYHRALSPQSVYVRPEPDGSLSAKIGNWATAQRAAERERVQQTALSHLSQVLQEEAGPYLALEAHSSMAAASADTDGIYLDVFSLGAIAYLLFTGKPPAGNDLELQDKLSRGAGLQVTDVLNGASRPLQDLVQYATHPDLGARIGSAAEFLEFLDKVEDELTRPDSERRADPAGAGPGDTFPGGIAVKRRLGRGASAVTFVVTHQGEQRVLKLAADPAHNPSLRQEGETLAKLRHQAVIPLHQCCELLGHQALIIDHAAEGSLERRLRHEGAFQLELLQRLGDDLLGALCHLEERGIAHRDIKPGNLGLTMQGNRLHLVLFDFSLSQVGADNITAGTAAYLDPFIRDPGRRRWDDYAERFAAALTLYEMATGTLPAWAAQEGMPPLIDGALEIDPVVFDPGIRDAMAAFFAKALARDVKHRFGNAEDMRLAWNRVFVPAQSQTSRHPTAGEMQPSAPECPVAEAQPDTQIGLLPLSTPALDTLSRLNVNSVRELLALPRNELVRMTGVGTQTRRELSQLIAQLRDRLGQGPAAPPAAPAEGDGVDAGAGGHPASIDQLVRMILPQWASQPGSNQPMAGQPGRAGDVERRRFLAAYLGRLDSEHQGPDQDLHWPTPVTLAAALGLDAERARALQSRAVALWAKNKSITALRHELAALLDEHGGVMTALELAEAVLLRRGSVQGSPLRERWARAVVRAAVETELARAEPRWIIRRAGRRILVADNSDLRGEERADYAQALGELADQCAEPAAGGAPLLSPVRTLEMIRAVPAPLADARALARFSNHRLLRLAAAASQQAALSSRAELYPRGLGAERAIELAQGALLGARALSVAEVHNRVHGRYPEAQPLPGRPQLDALMRGLDLGFEWNSGFTLPDGSRGAYCLPRAGLTAASSLYDSSRFGSGLPAASAGLESAAGDAALAAEQRQQAFDDRVRTALDEHRFLALSVRPADAQRAAQRLQARFGLVAISFDALLLRQLRRLCDGMARPPDWQVVLRADAAAPGSIDWSRLQGLVQRVLPELTAALLGPDGAAGAPVLLTDTGLIGRYGLVDSWLAELRRRLAEGEVGHALLLLIASDGTGPGARIEGVSVPDGPGRREHAAIPSQWLQAAADGRR